MHNLSCMLDYVLIWRPWYWRNISQLTSQQTAAGQYLTTLTSHQQTFACKLYQRRPTQHTRKKCIIQHIRALQVYRQRTTTILRPFFRDHPGEPVLEENFWTLWCKGRLTEADTQTIRLSATPSGLTGAHLHHSPHFLQARCPSCRPTNSVKALKATSTFGLGRRC